MVNRTDAEIYKLVDELMEKMTLEEKIGQLMLVGIGHTLDFGILETTDVPERIKAGKVGFALQNARSGGDIRYRLQKIAVEETRLGIPLMFNADLLHGFFTEFPIPLAISCSWDTQMIEDAWSIIAEEATCTGLNYTNAPMIEVSRDPRWGRVAEGIGEDPYLGSEVAKAQVRGFQGGKGMEHLANGHTMISAIKHYVGYSAAEGGRDYNTCDMSDNTLYNIYLRPFKAGVQEGAGSVMTSFNTINNEPVSCSNRMLKKILRDEFGFSGMIISDANSLYETIPHGHCESVSEAAYKGMKATLTIELGSKCYEESIAGLLEEGKLQMEDVNVCVRYNLFMKYKCGIMDNPYLYFDQDRQKEHYSTEHLAVARRAAAGSIVMTKNNAVLPIEKNKKIALIGPFGNSHDMLGTWSATPKKEESVTILEGLQAAGYDVNYAAGCMVHEEIDGGIEEAVSLVKDSDIVLLALGENSVESGEAKSKRSLHLSNAQMKLAHAVKEAGKPIVLLLTTGRPLILDWFDENVDGILVTWFLGSMAGHGIADVISAEHNPSAKLSMSFPRHEGQIPVYYNHQNTGRPIDRTETDSRLKNIYPDLFAPQYIDGEWKPLYDFGYGLSYSKFEYSDLRISADTLKRGEQLTVSVNLENTSDMDGTETVQLYLRDLFASAVRPVKELCGFKKVFVKAGEKVRVSFDVNEDTLKYYDAELNYVAENGEFRLFIGGSSNVGEYVTFRLVD
ncbi:MAG: glycoside hydrolase family 3 C-terminal domain-containing protein [Firmicutes bacterium]|nr:glycoside hydrolase family 3 C-terminal domain-containing protein [Bacillota bacterium]